VPHHSPYARQLRDIADALDVEFHPTDDALTPHPDTLDVISNRHTRRWEHDNLPSLHSCHPDHQTNAASVVSEQCTNIAADHLNN
jgi:hypothetical protein